MKRKKKTAELPAAQPSPQARVPVVGIGASAGGMAAFEAFFSALPASGACGAAFVVVQHLSPDHKSILAEILGRASKLPVLEVKDGMPVKPDCVYVIPPNRDMALQSGALRLYAPAPKAGQRLPIDYFLRTLAEDQGERAIAVILSGTGSDGTLGLRAVKAEGGIAIVQTPETAEYDGMPRSALATGLADFVAAPAEMPARIAAYVNRAFGAELPAASPGTEEEEQLKKILALLRSRTGNDFSQYKPNTVSRRIERRMALLQIVSRAAYLRHLQQDPAEADALFADMLIGVTKFFRDPAEFKALEKALAGQLPAIKPEGGTIRAWVPGCSTGEEAYSLAILLAERLEALGPGFSVQIFATDIDQRAIAAARAGIYPAGIAADLAPGRLLRFFTPEPGGVAYRANKNIRDMLVFSEQNVIKDPPFSRLDLISCRNLMIYLGPELQENLLAVFNYALNPGGLLFLGTAESAAGRRKLFEQLGHKAKIYRRRETARDARSAGADRPAPPLPARGFQLRPPAGFARGRGTALRELTERAILTQRGLAGALTDEAGEVLYLHGRSGSYLEPPQGEGGMNIIKMAREGLRRPLAAALKTAADKNEAVRQTGLRVKTNGDFTCVNMTVQPVKDAPAPGQRLFVVILDPAPPPAEAAPEPADTDGRIKALREELRLKEESLQNQNSELGYFNEALLSSNEELQSTNEELQSSNEELSTAKEELQSVNEELATVNAEQQAKVTELSAASNDMLNLLSSTGICAIFLDTKLRVKRFTPAVTKLVNLIPGDLGRPFGHTVPNLAGYDGLADDAQAVLDTLAPKDIEVQTKSGEWFLMRLRPYRTSENVIDGVTITFVDITGLRAAEAAMRRLATVLQDAQDPVIMSDLEGRIQAWNPAAERAYGWTEAEALGLHFRDLVPEDQRRETGSLFKNIASGKVVKPFKTRRLHKSGRQFEVWAIATALRNSAGAVYAISTTEKYAGQDRAR